jgi:predicted transcriptional regulator of viral defense system
MSDAKMKKRPEEIFRKHGGRLRMSEAITYGISRYMLYTLRDRGIIEQVSRGIYRLAELPPISDPDLVTVSLRFPHAVICLVSALAYHEITTQIPHEVSVAVPRNSRVPTLDYPPVRAHRFSKDAYESGIEEHRIDDVPVKIYCPEKTLADCFKFRNKIGMDIVLEALTLYWTRKKRNLGELLRYARLCRVEQVMRPYLEATV